MADPRRRAVDRGGGEGDLSAEVLRDDLVAQADPEERPVVPPPVEQPAREPGDPEVLGVAGPGRQHDRVRVDADGVRERPVGAEAGDGGPGGAERLGDVVDERIAVVDEEDLHRSGPATAASRTASFASVSAYSRRGSEA